MFEYIDGDITISRGDSVALLLSFIGETIPYGTVCLVSLKESTEDSSPIWEKRMTVRDGKCRLTITTDDTELDFGKYAWDVRLIFDGYDVETVLEPHEFVIAEVVGNA